MFDFDQYCLAAAVLFTALSLRQFRKINIVMLVNFLLFALADKLAPNDQLMILQIAYVLIGGLTVISLVKLKASPPLFVTSFLFSVYNLSIISEIVLFGSIGFHENFIVVAHSQMIIELVIMFLMSWGGFYVCRGLYSKSNYIDHIDRFFRVGSRLGSQGLT